MAKQASCTSERFPADNASRALVSIASVVCTFVFLIVIMIGVFARDQMIVAAYIAAALAVMGVALGALAVRAGPRTKTD